MTDKEKYSLNGEDTSSQVLPAIKPPKCDVEKYRDHVREFDLTPDEEAELLKNLWLIMAAFVDLGFGVDSIQILSTSENEPHLAPPSDANGPSKQFVPNGGIHDP